MKADSVGEPRLDKHLLEPGGKGGGPDLGYIFDFGDTTINYRHRI